MNEPLVRARSLTGNYQPLMWSHFIDVEVAARKLSQIAFPFTDVCHHKAQSAEDVRVGPVTMSWTPSVKGHRCAYPAASVT